MRRSVGLLNGILCRILCLGSVTVNATSFILECHPSKYFLMYLIVASLGTIACVFFLPINVWLRCTGVFFVILIFCDACKDYLFKKNNTRIFYDAAGQWFLDINNEKFDVALQPSTVVTRLLMVLNFKSIKTQKKYSIVLFPDSSVKAPLRMCRAYLLKLI